MYKIRNKFIALVVCCILISQWTITVQAKEIFIAKEEISIMLENIYEKYGMDYEFVSYNDNVQFTKEEVDNQLLMLEESLKNHNSVVINNLVGSLAVQPRVMETNKSFSTIGYASNGINGGASILLSCDTKINLGSRTFMDVRNINTRQYGNATNFVSWSQNSTYWTKEDGGRIVRVEATGTLTTKMEILGVRHRETLDHVIGMRISAG